MYDHLLLAGVVALHLVARVKEMSSSHHITLRFEIVILLCIAGINLMKRRYRVVQEFFANAHEANSKARTWNVIAA